MYAGVPITMPVCVRCPSSTSPISLAMPKSSSLAYESPCCGCTIQMLSGLRSRWTIPWRCAASSAWQICRRRRRASSGWNGPLLEPIGQALAVEELHHEVVAPVGQPPEREDVDDVRVADLVDRARLVDEPAHQLGIGGDLRRQHLDRDALADDGLDAGVDRPHAALADLALDAVLADLHPLGQIAGAGGAAVPPVDCRVVRAVVL